MTNRPNVLRTLRGHEATGFETPGAPPSRVMVRRGRGEGRSKIRGGFGGVPVSFVEVPLSDRSFSLVYRDSSGIVYRGSGIIVLTSER